MTDKDKKKKETLTENTKGARSDSPNSDVSDVEDKKKTAEDAVDSRFVDIIEKIEKLSVVDLADLVQALEKKFGVAAAVPTATAGVAGGGEEKSEYAVVLSAVGDQKINVIKAVKELTGLGLKEAKDLVDGAPKPIKEGVKKEEADEIKQKLEEAGATAELQ